MVSSGIPLDQWSGSAATNALRATIKELQEVSSRQTAVMIRLTWAIDLLAVAMLAGLGVQIYLAIHPLH